MYCFVSVATVLFLIRASATTTTTNPSGFVLDVPFAEPHATLYNGKYYAFATDDDEKKGSQDDSYAKVATSSDFSTGWTYEKNANVLPNPGTWVRSTNPQVWGPSVQSYSDTHFVMYYTALKPDDSKHCIGVATATTILGTYMPQSEPLICNGTISPYPFMYKNTPYLIYKFGARSHASIQLQQLSSDGTAKVGAPIELYQEQLNEYDTEAPAITFNPRNEGHPILLFVAGFYKKKDYRIKYAIAPTNSLIPPNGKLYQRYPQALLKTGEVNGVSITAPGSPGFPDPNDPSQMTFMTWENSTYGPRGMRTAIVTYSSNNTLSIG